MGIISTAARIVLGLIYFIFGGMGLAIAFGLMKMPEQPMSQAASTFFAGIMATQYFFPLLKITETTCGLWLLIGRGAPVALVILAPITLNIFLFHVYVVPETKEMILPSVMLAAHILAMAGYWNKYKILFKK